MSSRLQQSLVAAIVAATSVVAGCSDPHGGRQEVTGAVKLAGQPLKDGSITFIPLDNQQTQSGAAITNGEYRIPRASGLLPGKYLIQITAGDGKTPSIAEVAAPGGSTNIVSVDQVPEEWNTKSKQEREVKVPGPNRFDFEIPDINPKAKRR